MALRLTQPAVLCVQGVASLGVKQLACDTDHMPAFSTEVKNEFSNNFALHICHLGMHKDKAAYNLHKK